MNKNNKSRYDVSDWISRRLRNIREQNRWRWAVLVLAVLVSAVTMKELVFPAMAQISNLTYEQEESQYSEDVFIKEETEADFPAYDFKDVALTGIWKKDLAAVVNAENEIIPDEKRTDSADVQFLKAAFEYVGIRDYPIKDSALDWYHALSQTSEPFIRQVSDYTPESGDLIFFDTDDDQIIDRVGVVSEAVTEGNQVTSIKAASVTASEGLLKTEYRLDDNRIKAYAVLPENPEMQQDENSTESKPELQSVDTGVQKNQNVSAPESEANIPEEDDEEGTDQRSQSHEGDLERTVKGKDYTVTVRYGSEAKIPQDAELTVTELPSGTKDYTNHLKQAANALGTSKSKIVFSRFFDISFIKDGSEIEPSSPIRIQITYQEAPVEEFSEYDIVHFAEDGIEVLDATAEKTTDGAAEIRFEQNSLSVVGTIVTGSDSEFTAAGINGKYIIYGEYGGNMYALYSPDDETLSYVRVTKTSEGKITSADSKVKTEDLFWRISTNGNDTYIQTANTGKYIYWEYNSLGSGLYGVNSKLKLNANSTYITDPNAPGNKRVTPGITAAKNSSDGTIQFSKTLDTTYSYDANGGGTGTRREYIPYYIMMSSDGVFSGMDPNDSGATSNFHLASEGQAASNSIVISDDIKISGNLVPEYEGETEDTRYVWKKLNTDTSQYEEVDRKLVTYLNGKYLYNVTEDGKALNVSLDYGDGATYKVVALDRDGNEVAESEPYTVEYYSQVRNGSFEEPSAFSDYGYRSNVQRGQGITRRESPDYQPFYYSGSNIVWKTTAEDKLIEVVNPDPTARMRVWIPDSGSGNWTFKTVSEAYHHVDRASDGDQFAEINAESDGALYQDVLTIPGTVMHWSFDHRARGTGNSWDEDTMYMLMLPTHLAENVHTQADVLRYVNDPAYKDYVKEITSDNSKWHSYSGDITIPEGQYLTRFFFVAGSTAAGRAKTVDDHTEGNHIDNIHFSVSLPQPPEGQVGLVINKMIAGDLTQAQLDDLKNQLQIRYELRSDSGNPADNKSGIIKGTDPDVVWNGNQFTVTIYTTVAPDGNAAFKVEELLFDDQNNPIPETNGFKRSTVVNGMEGTIAEGTIHLGNTASVSYINVYEPGTRLPDTGGNGTKYFGISGILLMSMSFIYTLRLWRKKERRYR